MKLVPVKSAKLSPIINFRINFKKHLSAKINIVAVFGQNSQTLIMGGFPLVCLAIGTHKWSRGHAEFNKLPLHKKFLSVPFHLVSGKIKLKLFPARSTGKSHDTRFFYKQLLYKQLNWIWKICKQLQFCINMYRQHKIYLSQK